MTAPLRNIADAKARAEDVAPWERGDHVEMAERLVRTLSRKGEIVFDDGALYRYSPALLSEADCRVLEPHEDTFEREYGGLPKAGLSVALDQGQIRVAIRPPPIGRAGAPVLIIDPSSGRGDSFASALVRWVHDGERRVLVFSDLNAVEGKFFGIRSAEDIVSELATRAKTAKATRVISDQREELALEAAFRRNGMDFTSIPWTASSKAPAVERLRRLLADRLIVLPDDNALRRELANFQQKLMPSGYVTFGARASGKDDRVAVLLTAMMADENQFLEGSPLHDDSFQDALRNLRPIDFERLSASLSMSPRFR